MNSEDIISTKEVPYKDAYDSQQIITYCAKGDPIGNLRHDNDLGPYKFVDVKGGEKIPEKDDRLDRAPLIIDSFIERAKDKDGTTHLSPRQPLSYHSMSLMYEALKVSEYQNDRI